MTCCSFSGKERVAEGPIRVCCGTERLEKPVFLVAKSGSMKICQCLLFPTC